MPTYVYEVITKNGEPGERFELIQRMSDPELTHHPETGEPVRRIIQAPGIAKYSDNQAKQNLKDDRKLEQLGFTKYVKAGDGRYEKTAGKGPDVISKDKPVNPGDLPV